MPIDADGFREIFASLPTTVAVVTAVGLDGIPRGMTTNTVTALSRNPPLLLVCMDEASQTLPAVRESGFFAVNFLADSGDGISQTFAGKAPDKFARFDHLPARQAGGAPVFTADVVAHAECSVHAEIPAGDHSIVIGAIRAGAARDRAPLMYHRRSYSSWPPAQQLVAAD
ncbi:flavin reductase family protein [Streptomyces sp. I05A-00742]|uniref:flavin reductase family protein n=1 Tax=Streptomyces sp. I05A-00742 TaxID=2732853 RepID=UPI001489E34F|nr:flavin reductase family protein [Streptomyces sp. I05A-00742]